MKNKLILEVGDKFKVIDKRNCKYWDIEMDKWFGKIMTVREVDYTNLTYKAIEDKSERFGMGWTWHEEMIDWEQTKRLNNFD